MRTLFSRWWWWWWWFHPFSIYRVRFSFPFPKKNIYNVSKVRDQRLNFSFDFFSRSLFPSLPLSFSISLSLYLSALSIVVGSLMSYLAQETTKDNRVFDMLLKADFPSPNPSKNIHFIYLLVCGSWFSWLLFFEICFWFPFCSHFALQKKNINRNSSCGSGSKW